MNKNVKPTELPLEPTATEKRKMLIAGVEDFDAKVKPETAEEAVDNFLAKGALAREAVETKVRSTANSILASAGLPPVDRDYDDFDWYEDPSVVLRSQPATAIYHNNKGHIVIRQERSWSEDSDPYVMISPENAVTFMEALAKRARG
jgi:hypothetical protein